jgi:hypothetical protein
MTDTPDNQTHESHLETSVAGSRVSASGEAAERLVEHVGPSLKYPIWAAALSMLILSLFLGLSWVLT